MAVDSSRNLAIVEVQAGQAVQAANFNLITSPIALMPRAENRRQYLFH